MSDHPTAFPRCSGILLHPTSLSGPDGLGDLGAGARRFVDWLAEHGQSLWQVLPLGPTGYGDSPYQTLSALAGNPLLISCEHLLQQGWLEDADLADRPDFPAGPVDFARAIPWKTQLLDKAWERFRTTADHGEWRAWCRREAAWLDDYVLFTALKEEQEGRPWNTWPRELVQRRPEALSAARARLENRLDAHRHRQWLVDTQWQELKLYARARDVRILGDVPIFVAHDSCDVWAHPELFQLDDDGNPTSVAGVPPDYFSATGQLWGNPLYDWPQLKATGYRWWVERLRRCLEQVDLVRLDHFRGFAAYWEVPADAKTAEDGAWVPGPGAEFFAALRDALGEDLPLVAEDLGVITPDVEDLRDEVGLPGMKVLQFAWSDPANVYLPHGHRRHAVVFTGTHDNDTVRGWWEDGATESERGYVTEYLGREITEPHWELIRLGMTSPAHTFIAPLQDVLGLGGEARMNLPGAEGGNWNWRLPDDGLTGTEGGRLARLTWLTNRRPDQQRTTATAPPEDDS